MALPLLDWGYMYSVDWAAIRARPPRPAAAAGTTTAAHVRGWWFPKVAPVVWSLGFTSLLTDVSSEMVSSVLPIYLLLHLHVSPAAFGLIDGLYQGFALLVRMVAGYVGDRWRRHKAVATFGYALSAVCRLAILAVGGAWTGIAVVVAVDRAGKGIRTAPRDALISLATPPGELARAFGVHRALDAAGAMIGPLLAFVILTAMPNAYDVTFVVGFCVALVGLAVIALFVREPGRVVPVNQSAPALSPFALAGDPRLRQVAIAAGLLSVGTISDSFIFVTLQRQVGFDAGVFPLLFVAVSLVNFVLSAPSGQLADRFGRRTVFLAGHALLWCSYAALIPDAHPVFRLIVCLALLGSYYAATDGVLAAVACELLPRELYGSGLAFMASVTNAGRLLSSVMFGLAWSSWGLHTAIVLFMMGLAVGLVGATLVLRTAATIHDAPDPA
ncbi:MAG: MFS transporter [Acidobacteriota bacterium]